MKPEQVPGTYGIRALCVDCGVLSHFDFQHSAGEYGGVVDDEWREVTEDEVGIALHYAQRILEDLHDDRAEVEKQLKAKGRIP